MALYLALSGAGGIGKSTSLAYLADYFESSMPVVALGDIELPDPTLSLDRTVRCLAEQKLKENLLIQEYIRKGVLVLADRTCLDPLALGMTLLSEAQWRRLEQWYAAHAFVYGHHILLMAPHCVIRERRIRRGSSPRTSWLGSLDLSQERYEAEWESHWRSIHAERKIPFVEVDFGSEDVRMNCSSLLSAVKALATGAP